ncbi:MAG: NTP transferase domain-containing protein [Proteobacteria bacterium]|nr:NTP transferase domain-containing protein [Pseudomonadota bacterium]
MTTPTILILAGKRDGKLDPLAEKAGVSHKAVVPIRGKPLIQWVLEAAEAAWPDAPILVSIHDPAVLEGLEIVQRLTADGRLRFPQAQHGIVESLEAAVAEGGAFPLLITTGDNVLVTPEALRRLHDEAVAAGAGAALSIASREQILAAHPEGQRRFYEFRDVAISNCNAYWLRDRAALRAAESFRGGGQFIKTPGAILKAFGLWNLIGFRRKWWNLDKAMANLSRRFGVRIAPVFVTDGALAVDVDNERTYRIAETLLESRKPNG